MRPKKMRKLLWIAGVSLLAADTAGRIPGLPRNVQAEESRNIETELFETEYNETEYTETEHAETEHTETEHAETEHAETEHTETEHTEVDGTQEAEKQVEERILAQAEESMPVEETQPETCETAQPEASAPEEVVQPEPVESTPVETAAPEPEESTPLETAAPESEESMPTETAAPEPEESTPVETAAPEAEESTPVEAAAPEPVEGVPTQMELSAPEEVQPEESTPLETAAPEAEESTPVEAAGPEAEESTPVETAGPDPVESVPTQMELSVPEEAQSEPEESMPAETAGPEAEESTPVETAAPEPVESMPAQPEMSEPEEEAAPETSEPEEAQSETAETAEMAAPEPVERTSAETVAPESEERTPTETEAPKSEESLPVKPEKSMPAQREERTPEQPKTSVTARPETKETAETTIPEPEKTASQEESEAYQETDPIPQEASVRDTPGNAKAAAQPETQAPVLQILLNPEAVEPGKILQSGDQPYEGSQSAAAAEKVENNADEDPKVRFQIETAHISGETLSVSAVKEDAPGEAVTVSMRQDLPDGKIECILENIPDDPSGDGIYQITATAVDGQGRSVSAREEVRINRYGSRFSFSDSQGEPAVKDSGRERIICERNVDEVTDAVMLYSKDGEQVSLCPAEQLIVSEAVAKDGWHEYVYRLPEELFAEEGVYEVQICSKDKAGNTSSLGGAGETMQIFVDRTAPELVVTGIETGEVVHEDAVWTCLDVRDQSQIRQIRVFRNGVLTECCSGEALEDGLFKWKLDREEDWQTLQFSVTDAFGNTSVSKPLTVYVEGKTKA